MIWIQEYDPLHNLALSAFVAFLPIIFIFYALIIKKIKGYFAGILAVILCFILASVFYKMPVTLSLLSALHGALYGLFPICWIIIGAVFLYKITVASGQFEIIKNFIASITPDRRLQALLIAFSFGAFLEGVAGMGAPIAISAAMLVGLGFNPLYAAGICLIANTAPVAFGAVGTPIIIASEVSDIPEMAISQMVGRTLPVLSLLLPFYLVLIMAGFKKSMEVLPAILVCGVSFAFFQWLTSNYLGPMLPDVIAGIASILSLMILLRYWKPKEVWRFAEESNSEVKMERMSSYTIIKAWSPFIILTVLIIAWGLQPVQASLNSIVNFKFEIPGLHGSIQKSDGSLLAIKPFQFNILSSAGTALLLAAIVSIPLIGLTYKEGLKIYMQTLNQLKFAIVTIASIVAFAFLTNYSGMSVTMAMALAGTGVLFPFFSPVLGWLGVFLTGSDTSSNALFCKLQHDSATAIGIDPVITVSANVSGGVTGKMISPQSIAIGAAAVGLARKEAELFRFTVKHSFIMLLAVCILTLLQAYVFRWIIPEYKKLVPITPVVTTQSGGWLYLSLLALILSLIIATVIYCSYKTKILQHQKALT